MNGMLLITFVGAYFLGAVPFGVLIARRMGVDIFAFGSGNPGATNVYRALGKRPAMLVLALDVVKALIPALVARAAFGPDWALLVGLAAVVGHSLSPFIGFRGGKGIASGLGAILGSQPAVALGVLGTFLVLFGMTSFVSLASIAAALSSVVFALLFAGSPMSVALFVGLFIFVVYRHQPNIKRLREGTEPKFSFRASEEEAPEADGHTSEP